MVISGDLQVIRPLVGGLLIGGSAAALLLFSGRVAGISGVFARFLIGDFGESGWRPAFLVGLIAAGIIGLLLRSGPPPFELHAGYAILVIGGLLVGVGTRVGNGCTSGHGVCGLANLSQRSLAATLTFMGIAIATVFVVQHL